MRSAVRHVGKIERKYEQLPRYIVIPGDLLAGWKLTATATVEGTLNGMDLDRRGLKAWDVSSAGDSCGFWALPFSLYQMPVHHLRRGHLFVQALGSTTVCWL
jgi:hypothetical protein